MSRYLLNNQSFWFRHPFSGRFRLFCSGESNGHFESLGSLRPAGLDEEN